jgi:phosphonate transport system substrate-binding protein
VHFSFRQTRSVQGLGAGEFEVTALSHDKLSEMLAGGEIKPAQFRVVYESRVIPRLTIGHVWNLKPDLAEQMTKAALEFDNANAAADEATSEPMRFLAVDYRRDFEFVRRIDDSFDPRFGKKLRADLKP